MATYTTYTKYPDGTFSDAGWTPVGAGLARTTVADASDATYAYDNTNGLTNMWYSATGQAMSGIPYGYQMIVRWSAYSNAIWGGAPSKFSVAGSYFGGSYNGPATTVNTAAPLTLTPTDNGTGFIPWPSGLNPAGAFSLLVQHDWQPSAATFKAAVYQIKLLLFETTYPTATVTAAGTVTTTNPVVAWSYTDTDAWAHTGSQVKVFDSATYSAGGFNPATSTPKYTTTISGAGTTATATGLTNGVTYRTYVRVSKTVNGTQYWSGWANNTAWTVTALPPTTTVTCTWDTPTQSMTITAYGSINLLTANQSDLETDTTGWGGATNCTISRTTAQFKYNTASLQLSSTAAGTMTAATLGGTSGVPVTVGQSYVAQAYFRSATVARSVSVTIDWYNGASFLSASVGSTVTSSTANYNTLASVVATAPASATHASVKVTVASTAAGAEVHYVDAILLAKGIAAVGWNRGGATAAVGTLQRADPDVWRTVRGSTAATIDAAGKLVVVDYESRRGVAVFYKYTVATTQADGTYLSSDATLGSATATSDNQWWFKVVDDPAKNAQTNVLTPLKVSIESDVGVFRPLDASAAIAVTGQVYGEDGEYKFLSVTDTDYTTKIRPLMVAGGTILVQDPLGRHKWVRWTSPRDVEESYGGGQVRRNVTLGYIEVLPEDY